jgi:hypothetical protein
MSAAADPALERPAALQPRWRLRARTLALVVALALIASLAGWYVLRPDGTSGLDPSAFEQQTGVRVVRTAVSGAGGILDLRYLVVDPTKADAVHDASHPPRIIDERTGKPAGAPLMGHVHTGPAKAGVVYYVLFLNPRRLVTPGGRVSVELGGVRLRHVLVR